MEANLDICQFNAQFNKIHQISGYLNILHAIGEVDQHI